MPGFIKNVQGHEILFKTLGGLIETAHPLLSGSIEHVLPGLRKAWAGERTRWISEVVAFYGSLCQSLLPRDGVRGLMDVS